MKKYLISILLILTILLVVPSVNATDLDGKQLSSTVIEKGVKGLKVKSFRGDTGLAVETFVNKWLENNSEITIYTVQGFNGLISVRVFIWYKL